MEEGETRGRAGTGRSGGASAGHTHVMKGSQAQQLYCIFISRFIPWYKDCKESLGGMPRSDQDHHKRSQRKEMRQLEHSFVPKVGVGQTNCPNNSKRVSHFTTVQGPLNLYSST